MYCSTELEVKTNVDKCLSFFVGVLLEMCESGEDVFGFCCVMPVVLPE